MNKKLLDFQVNSFKRGSEKINMIPLELNKSIINRLFDSYTGYAEVIKENYSTRLTPEYYTENYYDKEVAKICLNDIMDIQCIYKEEKENRLYINEKDGICIIYFYGRDIGYKADYTIMLCK